MKLVNDNAQLRDRLLAIGSPILLLLLWEFAVRVGWLDGRFFPAPSAVFMALGDLATRGELLGKFWLLPDMVSAGNWTGVQKLLAEGDLWISLYRIFAGFVLGAVPGIVLGVLMGLNRTLRTALDPTISALYVLPKIVILPLIMIIFGLGETSKIVTVGISAFFVMVISTMVGVRDIDPIFFEAAKNYGANRWQTFWHVVIPAAMPVIFSGLRLSLGTALIVIVAAEYVSADYGLGKLIWFSWQTLLVENMYAGLVVVMVLGILFTSGLQLIEHRLMPWKRDDGRVLRATTEAPATRP